MSPKGNHRVGVIVAPRYFDTTSQELTELVPGLEVLHTQIRVEPDFAFTLDQIIDTAQEVSDCAAALAEAQSDAIVQLGTPFSTAHGWAAGNELRSRIEDRIERPFEMMGLSVLHGALALGLQRVALATTYYNPEWVSRYSGLVDDAGLEVTNSEGFVDQGLYRTHEESFAASFVGFTPETMVETIRRVAENSPDVDGIVVPGLPCRFLNQIATLESEIGKPVVSYYSIWWQCLGRLGVRPSQGHGTLMDLNI